MASKGRRASATIDASKSSATWQETFEKQNILAVKAFEKQLQSSISRDKEKLRVLVGGNYRELLSTADEIIDLNTQSRSTEAKIADLSLQCKPPEYSGTDEAASQPSRQAAQLRLLGRCILSASAALRSRSILLSAELAVISRAVLTSIAKFDKVSRAVENLRVKDTAIRRRLLRYVDSQLMNPTSSVKLIVESIGAYCLLTSASSSDAIKHFQDLRLFRLRQRFDSELKDSKQIRESFRYLINSVQTLKTLLSRGVNDILNGLQRQPILENPAISRLDVLQIDQARNLIPKDVLNFTPYIKRVVLQKDDVVKIIKAWAIEASLVATTGLRQALSHAKSVNETLKLRRDLLSIILPVYFSSYSHNALLEHVCEVINTRLHAQCIAQIEALLEYGKEMVARKSPEVATQDMWDPLFVQRLASSDNRSYLRQVQSRHLGTKGTIEKELKKMRTWSRKVKQLQSRVAEIRLIRWQDLIEEPEDGDEDIAATIINQLTKMDPEAYEASIATAIETTTSAFERLLQDEVAKSLTGETTSIAEVTFLIRALRESSAIITLATPSTQINTADMNLRLYQAVADTAVQRFSTKFESDEVSNKTVLPAGDDLPSPLLFSALRELCMIMTDIGGVDIWSPAATAILKQKIRTDVVSTWRIAHYAQNEFDVWYFKAAVASTEDADNDEDTREKAFRYWDRTKLLFGILS